MATKTFEELKQMAIQIRDEKTNKQNTATRIGTQMLEHLDKLEQEYYDKTNIDEQKKQTDTKFSELDDNVNIYFGIRNVEKVPLQIIEQGYYISYSTGQKTKNSSYSISEKVPVKKGQLLIIKAITTSSIALFSIIDSDGNYIPLQAGYHVYDKDYSQMMFVKKDCDIVVSCATAYMKTLIVLDSALCDYISGNTDLGFVTNTRLNDFLSSFLTNNLFNKDMAIDGYYVGYNGLEENSSYCASDFIPVYPDTYYSATFFDNARWYDKDKKLISSITSSSRKSPSNAAFMRLSVSLSNKDTYMINMGEELLPYESWGVKNIDKIISNINDRINSINEELEEMPNTYLKCRKSNNLFNKDTALDGYYVGSSGLVENESYCASDFIKVKRDIAYSASIYSNAHFYNTDKIRISSIPTGKPFTPNQDGFVRLSVSLAGKNTFMFCEGESVLPYEPFGQFLQENSFDDIIITFLKDKLGLTDSTFRINYFNALRQHLNNPFIKTQIKLHGDSITAGLGGTGFSEAGETITGMETKANVLTATCWSNMFYHYIDKTYNKDVSVYLDNSGIECKSPSSVINTIDPTMVGGLRKLIVKALLENNTFEGREFCTFTFFGDHLSVLYTRKTDKGKFDIYIDDTFNQTVDCYGEDDDFMEVKVSGLEIKTHKVSLRCTNSKNELSTSNKIQITKLLIPKTAIVKPWGIGGVQSSACLSTNGWISEEDDFVIIQLGTNDRFVQTSPDGTFDNLKKGFKQIIEKYDAVPILMCSCPASEYHETDRPDDDLHYFFHMWDVHDVVAKVADYYDVPFIDNYTAFTEYAEQHDITIDELLKDGLHPNDLGYKVMFVNIMKNLGLARLPFYNEWTGEEGFIK